MQKLASKRTKGKGNCSNIALLYPFLSNWRSQPSVWEALPEFRLPHEETDIFPTSQETVFSVYGTQMYLGVRGHCKSKERDGSAVPIWKGKHGEQY